MNKYADIGKLILRLGVGGLLIFHGVHKLIHGHDGAIKALTDQGLPEWLWIGVPFGEVIAPLLIIIGFMTRISSLLIGFTMFMSFYLVLGTNGLVTLNQFGGISGELNLLFFAGALALFFLGSGKYRVYKGTNPWLE